MDAWGDGILECWVCNIGKMGKFVEFPIHPASLNWSAVLLQQLSYFLFRKSRIFDNFLYRNAII
jgi:hypothetical protein